VERVGLGHVAGLWQARRPRQWADWKLESLVAVVEALACGHLLLREFGTRVLKIVVAEGPVNFSLCEKIFREALNLFAVGILTQWSSIAAVLVLAPKVMSLQ